MDTFTVKTDFGQRVPLNGHARAWACGSVEHWAAGAWGAWEAAVGRRGAVAAGTLAGWASQAAAALQMPQLPSSGPPR